MEVVHVSTPEEIRTWVKGEPAKARDALFLFDYELQGYRETGLSLAAELALGERVVLVTSRYEGAGGAGGLSEAQGAASAQGTGRVGADACGGGGGGDFREERLDAVLIDDDALTRMLWENDASDLGKAPSDVLHGREFLKEAGGIDRATRCTWTRTSARA